MKSIHIDFAPRSVARVLAQIQPLAWFAGTGGVILCIAAAIAALELVQQRNALEDSLRSAQTKLAERTAYKPVPKKAAIPEQQANAVNGAVAQLNLPWRDVLNAVEAATPATIALLALEPDAKKHLVKGLAEAKSSEGMVAYIELLKQQTFFETVTLTKHETNEQDPNKPIRFQFEAQWAESAE